jgi:extracellular matrix protein 14
MILDIWSMTPSHVDIRIPRTSVKGFLSLLPNNITEHEPIITNLRAAVDYTYPSERTNLPSLEELKTLAKSEPARQRADDIRVLSELFFSDYQSYATITQWLHLLEALRPELVQVVNIGESYEGRDILGVVIKGKKSAKSETLQVQETVREQVRMPGIIMHGGQHAREWISVSTACYIAYQLVTGYYIDDSVRKLVDEFEWRYPLLHFLAEA